MAHYNFFCNEECEYFPCHKIANSEHFNCLFCYCPLYPMKDCGGLYRILPNGLKDRSDCLIPHTNYDYVVKKLMKQRRKNNV